MTLLTSYLGFIFHMYHTNVFVASVAYVQPSPKLIISYVKVKVELLLRLLSKVSLDCTLLIH